jgi:hypothetical protein
LPYLILHYRRAQRLTLRIGPFENGQVLVGLYAERDLAPRQHELVQGPGSKPTPSLIGQRNQARRIAANIAKLPELSLSPQSLQLSNTRFVNP